MHVVRGSPSLFSSHGSGIGPEDDVSMPVSQIFPPSPSPTESIRLIYTSVSLLLSHTQDYCYHLSKSHIYALIYCIATFWLSYLILLWYRVVWAIYIFWILHLVSCIICKYFLPFWSLSFHWSVVSFVVQKLLSLIRSPLFIFGFVSNK